MVYLPLTTLAGPGWLSSLLDFPVNGDLAEDGVVLLEFETIRAVLPVLLRYVTAGAGLTAGLVLRALQNDQVTIAFAFLSHDSRGLNGSVPPEHLPQEQFRI